MKYHDRVEREKRVQAMIAEGLTVRQIAARLGIRHETVRRFLKTRGWETESQRQHREMMEEKYGDDK